MRTVRGLFCTASVFHIKNVIVSGRPNLQKVPETLLHGADPDPLPYLVVSMEDKRKDQLKTYDPKKSYWVPDGKGGYCESMLVDNDGKKATVMCGHEVRETQILQYVQNIK